MIVFDLRCATGHVFEAWFGSGAQWEQQRADGQVACPICGDADIAKAVMAPAVPAKGNRREPLNPARVKAAMQAIAAEQSKALAKSTWVGDQFASRARAMHDGEERQRIVHGQATLADAKALADDGVPVVPLLLPVAPPRQLN